MAAFRQARPDAVLAEFGSVGVQVREACRRLDLPLLVHFRGYDASSRSVLEAYADEYPKLFEQAVALVVSSHTLGERLVELGAPANKIHWSPSGVDTSRFAGGDPAAAEPVFLAAGRLVDKKAPHLTLFAFSLVRQSVPDSRLRMIGDGPLLGVCTDLAHVLGIEDGVDFLGLQSYDNVADEMRNARAFVQHSVVATGGEMEGTPAVILEASSTGLPVVSTRHSGIPDAVEDGVTGFIVEERDVGGMAERMITLAQDPALAATLGARGRERMLATFSTEHQVPRLMGIIERAVAQHREARR